MSDTGMAKATKRLDELEQAEKSDRPSVPLAMGYIEERVEFLATQVEKLAALLEPVSDRSTLESVDTVNAVHPGPLLVRQLVEVGQRLTALVERLQRMQRDLVL